MRRGSRRRSRTASRAPARWWLPGRPGPRSSGCGGLVLPDDADDDPLHDDVALVHAQGVHGGIGGLEPDPPSRLAIELLHGGVLTVHQRHDRLTVVGLVALVDDDEVAVLDVLVDHRGAAHLEDVAAAAARHQLVGHGDGVVAAHRLDRLPRGHQTEQPQLGGPALALWRHDLDRPALVVRAPDVPFPLENGDVLVHRGERLESELASDLLEAGRVALGVDVAGDEVEDLALAAGERHTFPERKPKLIYPKIDRTQGCPRPDSTRF